MTTLAAIASVNALEVLDSRGNPTLAVTVLANTKRGSVQGSAMVPSGASTGALEAFEKRDAELSKRYLGRGVLGAVKSVGELIAPALKGIEVTRQAEIDSRLIALDGTENLSKIGANAILGVSLAAARAAANFRQVPLYKYLNEILQDLVGGPVEMAMPVPMLNVLNGGAHADNALDIQEFMVYPNGFASFASGLRAGVEVYHHLAKSLKASGHSLNVGDEGGFAPNLARTLEALEFLAKAVERAGYKDQVELCVDLASSEFYQNGKYDLKGEGQSYGEKDWVGYLAELVAANSIYSLEDPMAETDWQGWQSLTEKLGKSCQLVADDIFVTKASLLKKGAAAGVGNSILVKLNQVGSLSATLQTIKLAKELGYTQVISHRSGDTEDAFIADLTVASGCGQIKAGAPARAERTAKYNRLLAIEAELAGELAKKARGGGLRYGPPIPS